jgi:ribose transport system permease protein
MTARGLGPRLQAWRGLPVAALVVLLVVVNTLLRPDFLGSAALSGFLATYAPAVCLAIGVSFAMLVGGIDLSVGPVMGLANIVTVLLASVGAKLFALGPDGTASACSAPGACEQGWPFLAAACGGVAVGALFGLLNGVAVALLRLQPLLATLATGFVAGGAGLWLFPKPGGQIPEDAVVWYASSWLVPKPALLLVVVALAAFVLLRTPLGVRMRATGSDRWRAFAARVHVPRVALAAYVASGALAGVAGVLLTLNVASGDPNLGETFTLTAIAGAVLGGAALQGGWAEPFGPALGALALGLLNSLIDALDIPTYYQQLGSGLVIVLGLVAAQGALQRRRAVA